jgi:hypothetical protein
MGRYIIQAHMMYRRYYYLVLPSNQYYDKKHFAIALVQYVDGSMQLQEADL